MDADGRQSPAIEGMESVIATVSGYHGTERFTLIKLIAHTGANYVGAMARSTTHLVCWKLEGKKFDLAMEFGTMVVSHRWFEDCLREGKRLPEGPYTMQSGQEAGPISWEVPDVLGTRTRRKSSLSTERNILSDQSDTSHHNLSPEIHARCPDVEYLSWPGSSLLTENSSRIWDTPVRGSKKVRKTKKTSKHSNVDHSRPPVIDLGSLETSSSFKCSSSRQKRNLHDISGSNVISESARRSRRLAENNAPFNIVNRSMLVSKRENCLQESYGHIDITNSESVNLDVLNNSITSSPLRLTPESMSFASDGDMIQELHGTTSPCGDSEYTAKMAGSCFSGVNPDEQKQDGDGACESAGVKTQTEVSCVICWTDFCSTRGVLPCGHRFCYSCIAEWADCMASKGKVSTCPLCKMSFISITKFEGSTSPDQKIYSQTIPCGSSRMDILRIFDGSADNSVAWPSGSVCHECCNREPEDLLVSCHICRLQSVHTCCLDPPLVPWTCIHCRDLRTLYQRYR